MSKCTASQVAQIKQMESEQQMTLDPTQVMGCSYEQPRGNAAAQQACTPAPDVSPGDLFTPGRATLGGLEMMADFIENGLDGKKDGAGAQALRAIPGALGMGAAMILGRGADLVDLGGRAVGAWGTCPDKPASGHDCPQAVNPDPRYRYEGTGGAGGGGA